MLSKKVSSTNFKVFGMTRPRIEPRSPGPLVNTLPTRQIMMVRVFANDPGDLKLEHYGNCTIQDTRFLVGLGGILLHHSDVVGVFYSLSRLDNVSLLTW